MKQQTIELYDYHDWANQKVFEHLKELPRSIYQKKIQSVFSSISEVLVHIYLTDITWLGVMSNKSYHEIAENKNQVLKKVNGKSLEEMEIVYGELSLEMKEFFKHYDYDQRIYPEHPTYGRLETNIFELVQHVVNHGTYHRGNITAMLRQLGFQGIGTDYVFYLYVKKTGK
ncbi:DinB family protein [Metabacillus sp. Hm71]|uniref:DinB family protein n=1 Tax=Metabacillus sp. Hm71 TaxID=3450743 RepID=UPI003F4430D6